MTCFCQPTKEQHFRDGSTTAGERYTFTIQEGADGRDGRISVNYDGFIDDVSVGDIMLVDGGIMSFAIVHKDGRDVVTEVVDGGIMKSRSALGCASCHLSSFLVQQLRWGSPLQPCRNPPCTLLHSSGGDGTHLAFK
jgi:predicted RNA-binding protein with TRAM domain